MAASGDFGSERSDGGVELITRTPATVVSLPHRKAREINARRPPTPAVSTPAATARYPTGGG